MIDYAWPCMGKALLAMHVLLGHTCSILVSCSCSRVLTHVSRSDLLA